MSGDKGNDTISGGTNNPDKIDISPDLIYGGEGDDFVDGSAGNDSIDGGEGNDIALGGEGDDLIHGEIGDDQLIGDNGNDTLCGNEGNDLLVGGEGNDLLDAGAGDDLVTGGSGEDVFALSSLQGTDVFTDFEDGIDRVGLACGITLDDVQVLQGDDGALVSLISTGQVLALLQGVDVNNIDDSDFAVFDSNSFV